MQINSEMKRHLLKTLKQSNLELETEISRKPKDRGVLQRVRLTKTGFWIRKYLFQPSLHIYMTSGLKQLLPLEARTLANHLHRNEKPSQTRAKRKKIW